jgi:hypothetical protein
MLFSCFNFSPRRSNIISLSHGILVELPVFVSPVALQFMRNYKDIVLLIWNTVVRDNRLSTRRNCLIVSV